MSLAVIKKYANLYSISTRMTIRQNYTLFFSLKSPYSPSSLFLLVIESQEKINGMGIIFNFGMKWVSGEIYTGREGEGEKDWKLD